MGAGASAQKGKGRSIATSPAGGNHGKASKQPSDLSVFAHRSWVMISHAEDVAATTKRIVCGLQEGGLLVRGDRKLPLKKREELLHDQGCGAYLAVISKGFEKSKDLKVEFERVSKQGTSLPTMLVMAGPKEFVATADWLLPSIEEQGGPSKLIDFRGNDPAAFDRQIALVMLQLLPNHVSTFARELSAIAAEVPKLRASDAVQALQDASSDLKACRSTLRDLVGLTLDASSGHILTEAMLMPELKSIFQLFGMKSPEVALSICWAIGNMLACAGGLEEQLYEQGAAEVVMRSMGAHEKDPAVQQHGCLALQRLVQGDMLVDTGVIGSIQTALKDHGNDNNVQLQGIRLVQAILISNNISDANKKKVADKMAPVIKKAAKAFSEGSLLHEAAVSCSLLILDAKDSKRVAKARKEAAVKAEHGTPTPFSGDSEQPSYGSVSSIKDNVLVPVSPSQTPSASASPVFLESPGDSDGVGSRLSTAQPEGGN